MSDFGSFEEKGDLRCIKSNAFRKTDLYHIIDMVLCDNQIDNYVNYFLDFTSKKDQEIIIVLVSDMEIKHFIEKDKKYMRLIPCTIKLEFYESINEATSVKLNKNDFGFWKNLLKSRGK